MGGINSAAASPRRVISTVSRCRDFIEQFSDFSFGLKCAYGMHGERSFQLVNQIVGERSAQWQTVPCEGASPSNRWRDRFSIFVVSSMQHRRVGVRWLDFLLEEAINSRLVATNACSASISAKDGLLDGEAIMQRHTAFGMAW